MTADEAMRLGIAMEIPPGEKCPFCNSPGYSCGTRQSVKSYYGKSIYRSSLCMGRGESAVLRYIQELREQENQQTP